MQDTLRRMREERAAGDRGFTLIEMLVVVVIIGVLVGIAVPLFMNYRKGAANKSAQSDVRNAITAIESFYSTYNSYPTAVGTPATADITLKDGATDTTDKIVVSTDNSVAFATWPAAGPTYYKICAQNSTGKTIYGYDSQKGGQVKAEPSSVTDIAGCLANHS